MRFGGGYLWFSSLALLVYLKGAQLHRFCTAGGLEFCHPTIVQIGRNLNSTLKTHSGKPGGEDPRKDFVELQ